MQFLWEKLQNRRFFCTMSTWQGGSEILLRTSPQTKPLFAAKTEKLGSVSRVSGYFHEYLDVQITVSEIGLLLYSQQTNLFHT